MKKLLYFFVTMAVSLAMTFCGDDEKDPYMPEGGYSTAPLSVSVSGSINLNLESRTMAG